jgi:hypothetical protein
LDFLKVKIPTSGNIGRKWGTLQVIFSSQFSSFIPDQKHLWRISVRSKFRLLARENGHLCLLKVPPSVQWRMTRLANFLLVFLCFGISLSAQSSFPSREQIYDGLSGEWTGQLEYRDFSTEEHVVLPAWLEVKPAADGKSLQFTYIYDDGPTKIVTSSSTVAIDPASHRYTVTSDHDHSSDMYQIADHDVKNGMRQMEFVLTGTGKENDKPVEVRITITIERNLYRFRKETRLAGQEFLFRDAYTFTRRNPIQSKP